MGFGAFHSRQIRLLANKDLELRSLIAAAGVSASGYSSLLFKRMAPTRLANAPGGGPSCGFLDPERSCHWKNARRYEEERSLPKCFDG